MGMEHQPADATESASSSYFRVFIRGIKPRPKGNNNQYIPLHYLNELRKQSLDNLFGQFGLIKVEFLLHPASGKQCHEMVLATFADFDGVHAAMTMYNYADLGDHPYIGIIIMDGAEEDRTLPKARNKYGWEENSVGEEVPKVQAEPCPKMRNTFEQWWAKLDEQSWEEHCDRETYEKEMKNDAAWLYASAYDDPWGRTDPTCYSYEKPVSIEYGFRNSDRSGQEEDIDRETVQLIDWNTTWKRKLITLSTTWEESTMFTAEGKLKLPASPPSDWDSSPISSDSDNGDEDLKGGGHQSSPNSSPPITPADGVASIGKFFHGMEDFVAARMAELCANHAAQEPAMSGFSPWAFNQPDSSPCPPTLGFNNLEAFKVPRTLPPESVVRNQLKRTKSSINGILKDTIPIPLNNKGQDDFEPQPAVPFEAQEPHTPERRYKTAEEKSPTFLSLSRDPINAFSDPELNGYADEEDDGDVDDRTANEWHARKLAESIDSLWKLTQKPVSEAGKQAGHLQVTEPKAIGEELIDLEDAWHAQIRSNPAIDQEVIYRAAEPTSLQTPAAQDGEEVVDPAEEWNAHIFSNTGIEHEIIYRSVEDDVAVPTETTDGFDSGVGFCVAEGPPRAFRKPESAISGRPENEGPTQLSGRGDDACENMREQLAHSGKTCKHESEPVGVGSVSTTGLIQIAAGVNDCSGPVVLRILLLSIAVLYLGWRLLSFLQSPIFCTLAVLALFFCRTCGQEQAAPWCRVQTGLFKDEFLNAYHAGTSESQEDD